MLVLPAVVNYLLSPANIHLELRQQLHDIVCHIAYFGSWLK
jgi:hypothetical protein